MANEMTSVAASIEPFNQVFSLNTKVKLHDLESTKFNGKTGVITQCLNQKNTERFGIRLDDEEKSLAVRPTNLMTVDGVPPVFIYDWQGIKIPCRAQLGVSGYNDIGVVITCSDHIGLDALQAVGAKFFGVYSADHDDLKQCVGQQIDRLSTSLVEYRPKPNEIAIATYKAMELAKCMEKQGLIKFTGKTVKQGYGEFAIAKICFQQMFYHNVQTYQ